jgi:hypothetical protein
MEGLDNKERKSKPKARKDNEASLSAFKTTSAIPIARDPDDDPWDLEEGWQEVAWSARHDIDRTKMSQVLKNNKVLKYYRKPWHGTWGRERPDGVGVINRSHTFTYRERRL